MVEIIKNDSIAHLVGSLGKNIRFKWLKIFEKGSIFQLGESFEKDYMIHFLLIKLNKLLCKVE